MRALNGGALSKNTACRNETTLWGSVEFHMLGEKREREREKEDLKMAWLSHHSVSLSFPSANTHLFFLPAANQPHSKVCMPAYLFPFPVSHQTHNATEYDSAISEYYVLFNAVNSVNSFSSCNPLMHSWLKRLCPPVYRGFWSIFMLIGVVAVALAGFVIICAAPFASHRLYKAGGGLFLASGE